MESTLQTSKEELMAVPWRFEDDIKKSLHPYIDEKKFAALKNKYGFREESWEQRLDEDETLPKAEHTQDYEDERISVQKGMLVQKGIFDKNRQLLEGIIIDYNENSHNIKYQVIYNDDRTLFVGVGRYCTTEGNLIIEMGVFDKNRQLLEGAIIRYDKRHLFIDNEELIREGTFKDGKLLKGKLERYINRYGSDKTLSSITIVEEGEFDESENLEGDGKRTLCSYDTTYIVDLGEFESGELAKGATSILDSKGKKIRA